MKQASTELTIVVGFVEQVPPNLYPVNCIMMNNYSKLHLSIHPLYQQTTSK